MRGGRSVAQANRLVGTSAHGGRTGGHALHAKPTPAKKTACRWMGSTENAKSTDGVQKSHSDLRVRGLRVVWAAG
jgi:hypothetical protein